MPVTMRKSLKYLLCFSTGLLIFSTQSLYASGPPAPSALEDPIAIGFLILMLLLLLVIGLLANLLLGVAQVKAQKEKKEAASAKAAIAVLLFILFSCPLFAQDNASGGAATTVIAHVSTTAFYIMASVVLLELVVILVLLMNVRVLLKVDRVAVERALPDFVWKKRLAGLWKGLNRFKPVEQEADIDLGHDYDGIRELDNRLPPWWLYGFYITILTAGIYLYRFHISHTGPSAEQEYTASVAKADIEVKEYLKKKGDQVDENTVTLLTASQEIEEGKTIFQKSCVACHSEGGAGNVGPNLTDDYWLHGGDIKSIFKTIRYGINAMPQWQNSFSNKQIAELSSYVISLKGTNPANAKPPQGVLFKDDNTNGKQAADSSSKKDVGLAK